MQLEYLCVAYKKLSNIIMKDIAHHISSYQVNLAVRLSSASTIILYQFEWLGAGEWE